MSCICEIKTNDTNELIYKTEIENEIMVTRGKVEVGLDREFGIDVHIDIFKRKCFSMEKGKLLMTPLPSSLNCRSEGMEGG